MEDIPGWSQSMGKLFLASICMTALVFASGFAAGHGPSAESESPSSRSSTGADTDKLDQVVEHLLKAADHLEAAGLVAESAKLRDDARQRALRANVLSRKEAELECLQEEVDRLRVLTGQVPIVVIEIVAIEVDRAKLGLKARDFDTMVGFAQPAPEVVPVSTISGWTKGQPDLSPRSAAGSGIVESNPWRLPLFRELREKGAINVLAHPTVQTATHRPASASVGGEIPIRVKSSTGEISIRSIPFGTRVEVRAVVLPNHRIRLQSLLELTKIDGEGVVDDDGTAYPGLSSRRLNTEVEMQLGQTLAVGRMVFDRPVVAAAAADEKPVPNGSIRPVAHAYAPSESVETIVFITPRLVQGGDTPQATNVVPAASSAESEGANVPADYVPTDWDVFGPVVPVMKRRTTVRP
jgi:hypothetical protein